MPVITKNLPILISIIFALIYAMFPTSFLTADGLYYAWHIENLPLSDSFHPHHLFWLGLMHLIYNLVHSVLPNIRSLQILQITNAIFGGLSVFMLIRLTAYIAQNSKVGIIIGLLFGLSWGMIHFSTDANIYILVLLLILFTAYILITSGEITRQVAIAPAILLSIATLLHQVAILFSIAIIYAVWLKSPVDSRRKILIQSVSVYVVLIVAVYFIAFYTLITGIPQSTGFIKWLTAYSAQAEYWTIFTQGFYDAAVNFCRTQVYLFLHLQDQLNIQFAQEQIESKRLIETFFVFNLIIVASVIWEIRDIMTNRNLPPDIRTIKTILLAWLIPYYIFNFLYCPHEIHFKLYYLPPLLILWSSHAQNLRGFKRKFIKYSAITFVILLAVLNISTGLIPNRNYANNPYFHIVEKLKPHVQKGDLVIFARHERNEAALIRYFTDADSVFFRPEPRHTKPDDLRFFEIHDISREFMTEYFDRILISDAAWQSEYPRWFIPEHLFKRPRPDEIAISKFRLFSVREIQVDENTLLHEVKFPIIAVSGND